MSKPQGLPPEIVEHIRLYREDPEKAHHWDSTPLGGPGVLTTLLLTTRGRKSGEPRSLPLVYQQVNRCFVVVASKKGAPAHPAWYLNLQARPECEIQVGNEHYRVRARDAEGEERERLWSVVTAAYPPYDEYQAAAGKRRIPVVVLDPVDE
ncbi:MAG: nitroreductase family deazaflavin-dependent oxidoreductase [bacterium]|nr:nitroreductase family deazaflavin-dependent oxidoreductase [bacterium]